MSVYFGMALPSTAVYCMRYGHFLSEDTNHLILVRKSSLDVVSLVDGKISSCQSVPVYGNIVAIDSVQFDRSDKILGLAILLQHDVLLFAKFTPDCRLRYLSRQAVPYLDNCSSCYGNRVVAISPSHVALISSTTGMFIYTWVKKQDGTLAFSYTPFRRYSDIVDISPLRPYHSTHDKRSIMFGMIEKAPNKNTYQVYEFCSAPEVGAPSLTAHTDAKRVDLPFDTTMVIPLDLIPSGVLIVTTKSIFFTSPTSPKPVTFAFTGPTRYYTAYAVLSLSDFLLVDQEGHVTALRLVTDKAEYGLTVKDVVFDVIGQTSVPMAVQALDDGYLFCAMQFSDHRIFKLSVEQPGWRYNINVHDTMTHIGGMHDMLLIERSSRRKLVVASGFDRDGCIKVIKNSITVNQLAEFPTDQTPVVWPLNSADPTKPRRFLLNTAGVYQFVNIWAHKDEIEVVNDIPASSYAGNLFQDPADFANVVHFGFIDPHFLVKIGFSRSCIVGLDTGTGADYGYEFDGATAADVGVNGDIVLAQGNVVRWFHFDPTSPDQPLRLLANQAFPAPIWKVNFADAADGQLCFVVPESAASASCVYICQVPKTPGLLEWCQAIAVPRSRIVHQATLLHFPAFRSYIVFAMDDGSVDYRRFNVEDRVVGPRETIVVGNRPVTMCKARVGDQPYLVLCSDQPSVMRYDKHNLGFCALDVDSPLDIVSLSAAGESNGLLVVSKGSVKIGNLIDLQRITTQTVPVGETVLKLAYDESCNAIIGVTENCVQLPVDLPEAGGDLTEARPTPINTFPHHKKQRFTASEPQAAQARVVQFEQQSLALFDADSFDVLDVYELETYEQVYDLKTVTIDWNVYVLVGSGILLPHQDSSTLGRLLVYSITPDPEIERPTLRYVMERQFRSPVFAIGVSGSRIKIAVDGNSTEVTLNLERSTIDNVRNVPVGIFVPGFSNTYSPNATSFVRSELVPSICFVRSLDEHEHRSTIAVEDIALRTDFLDDKYFIAGLSNRRLTLFEDATGPLDENEHFVFPEDRIHKLGSMYCHNTPSAFATGTPFLAFHKQAPDCTSKPAFYGFHDGSIAVVFLLDPELFSVLKKIEKKLDDKLATHHNEYRNPKEDFSLAPFVDGNFLDYVLAENDAFFDDVEFPENLRFSGKRLPVRMEVFRYLRQLWAMH